MFRRLSLLICALLLLGITSAAPVPQGEEWAPFVQRDFPFFSSVLDARTTNHVVLTNNLTPRGIILNLGNNMWACIDLDLVRVAAIWEGEGVTPVSMSQGSYTKARALIKAQEGQTRLPQPLGKLWLGNGLYPGVLQNGTNFNIPDPRELGPDPREIGRGPLPQGWIQFKSVRVAGAGVELESQIGDVTLVERFTATKGSVTRQIRIAPHQQPLVIALGVVLHDAGISMVETANLLQTPEGVRFLQVPSSTTEKTVTITLGTPSKTTASISTRNWDKTITTTGILSPSTNAYVLDQIPLPLTNLWKRNVRIADLALFGNGEGAVVTFDGDVWLVSGLKDDLRQIDWRRFASGFHEPMGIVARDRDLFVFDRNGLWQLIDEDGNGEADRHLLFCNNFTQTAETREFTTGLKLAPNGEFIISKGGQQSTTVGRHNGSVLRISADGKSVTELGRGFRMPFIGVHPVSGLITASDQQGHYVPSTPIHVVRKGNYYGFIPLILPKEKYPAPIAEPLTWIPHSINPSAVSQVWPLDERFGPFSGNLIHLGYYRPEIFLAFLDHTNSPTRASVVSITRDIPFPILNGIMNPADGQLYLTGFQIWGTEAEQISGLARLRYTGKPSPHPAEIIPTSEGVMLSFAQELMPDSILPQNFVAERWNYQRTPEYGSPHFRLDGAKGQETLPASAAYLSLDKRKVFVAIPGMQKVMQMRLGWTILSSKRTPLSQNAYFTVHELPNFDPAKHGFGDLKIDLTPVEITTQRPDETPITIEEGSRLASLMGCVACHSVDGSNLGKVGPSWKGLFASERTLANKSKVKADEPYLRRSILKPASEVVAGFDKSDTGMPSYDGVLTPSQIEAIILYIKSIN